jgi:hypothetical protein
MAGTQRALAKLNLESRPSGASRILLKSRGVVRMGGRRPVAQTFEAFLSEWRMRPLPLVKGNDLEAELERRSRELMELAIGRGFRAHLSEACRPYRSMKEFVRALYDASHHERKRDGKDGL